MDTPVQATSPPHRPPVFSGALRYEGSEVLINKRGILDIVELHRFETGAITRRSAELAHKPVRGNFDGGHLLNIHERLYRDVYAWAGHVRPGSLEASDTARHSGGWEGLENELKWLHDSMRTRGNTKEDIVHLIASGLSMLDERRLFATGNRRTAEIFMKQLAHAAGYDFDPARAQLTRWAHAYHAQYDHRRPGIPNGNPDIVSLRNAVRDTTRPLIATAFAHAIQNYDPVPALRRFPRLGPILNALDRQHEQWLRTYSSPEIAGQKWDTLVSRIQRKLDSGIHTRIAWDDEILNIFDRSRGRSR